jgi:hypothetical protein
MNMKTPQQIADSVVRKTAGIIPDDLAKSYFFSNPYGLDFHTWAGMQDTNQGEDIPTEAMPEVEGEEPPYDSETEAEYMPNAPDTPEVGTEPTVSPTTPVPLPAGRHKKTAALLQMVAARELTRRGILKISNGDESGKPVVRQKVEEFLRRNQKMAGDLIPGGKAQGEPDSKYPSDQMAMGQKVETEHTPDTDKAREIARDHLEEFPNYYTALKQMEDHLKQQKQAEDSSVPKYDGRAARETGKKLAAAKFGLDAAALLGQDEQRKDDIHQQQIRHNEENHEIELQKGQLELQQAQETFGMKQQQQAQKNQEQQAQQQMMQQQQAQQQQAQSQQWMANMAGGGGGQQPPQQGRQAPR